eukprot:UN11376
MFVIRDELKITFKILLSIFILLIITIAFIDSHEQIALNIMLICVEITMTLSLYVLIIYPQKKFNHNQSKLSNPMNTLIAKTSGYVSWKKIIESDDGFEQFANFLEKEFSAENILFVTEYVQLKNAMIECDNLQQIIVNELELSYTLKLPKSVPMSLTCKQFTENLNTGNEENMNAMILSATKELFLRYIDPSKAMLEVNISSAVRAQLINAFRSFELSNNALETILPLFENAVMEISFLMNDSHRRFKKTG